MRLKNLQKKKEKVDPHDIILLICDTPSLLQQREDLFSEDEKTESESRGDFCSQVRA